MPRSRTDKTTIKNDPWASVIPAPGEWDELSAIETTEPEPPAPVIQDAATGGASNRAPRAARATNADQPVKSPEGAGRIGKQKLTVHLPHDLADRVKNAAYWNPKLTIAAIAEHGIKSAIEKYERENGGRYPPREGELVGGRPIR